MLIDVHAHFFTDRSGRSDWEERNASRLTAGRRMGVTAHVASILGTWGARSPVYFPSADDVRHANDRMAALCGTHRGLVFGYCLVNPNYPDLALAEIDARATAGFVGIKLAASRRATDPLLDPIAEMAATRGLPVLHHVWQHRWREWPGQEASDAVELAELAARHPRTTFILAHLGGGGDWQLSLRAVRDVQNVLVDLSGSGIDTGMLEQALESVGVDRLLWGGDVTQDTALAKLRYLETLDLPAGAMDAIRYGNAERVFPAGCFR